jgi:hypothetical protein
MMRRYLGGLEANKARHRSRYTLLRQQSPHQRRPRKSVAVSVWRCAQRRLDFGFSRTHGAVQPSKFDLFLNRTFRGGNGGFRRIYHRFFPVWAIFRREI